MTFTIITPSYNRANTLPKLYNSIKKQSERSFEWIIVDDGSNDNTKELVQTFKDEHLVKIHYIHQKNQGKHVAVNTGIKNAHGKFIMVIDSDDYFSSKNSIKIAQSLAKEIENDDKIAGFSAIRFSENLPIDHSKYGNKKWLNEKQYTWEHHGEMIYTYKREIAEKYLFPQFIGEKFCPESLIHRRIRREGYKILRTNYILFNGDYLNGGLSNNYYQLMLNNPNAALLSYKEKIQDTESYSNKIQLAESYWDIVLKNYKTTFYKHLFNIHLTLTLRVSYRLFKNKISKLKYYKKIK